VTALQRVSNWPALRAFGSRDYVLFYVGQLVSQVGSWMQMATMPWLVYNVLHGTKTELGAISAMNSLPVLIFSLIGGLVVDRSEKRGLLVITQALQMALAFLFAWLVASGHITIALVLLVTFAFGVVNTVDLPARQSILPELVDRHDLPSAIALGSVNWNIARIVGPSIAGLLLQRASVPVIFVINGLSFLAVIGGLLLMRIRTTPAPAGKSPLEDLREAIHYVRGEPVVQTQLLLALFPALFGFVYGVLLAPLATDVLRTGARGYGMLMAAPGIGAIIAGLTLSAAADYPYRGRVLMAGGLLWSVSLLLLSTARTLPAAIVYLAMIGWSFITQMSTNNTMLQARLPDHLRARVMSLYNMAFIGAGPFGALLAGWMGDTWDVPTALWTLGLVYGGCMLLVAFTRGQSLFIKQSLHEERKPVEAKA
jgi:MFS family permease